MLVKKIPALRPPLIKGLQMLAKFLARVFSFYGKAFASGGIISQLKEKTPCG